MTARAEYCAGQWSNTMAYPMYVVPVCRGLGALFLLPFIATFIKAYREKKLSSENRLYVASLIFFIVTVLYYIPSAINHPLWCNPSVSDTIYVAVDGATYALYALHNILLVINLFCRLLFIFRGSVLAISKCVKLTFVILLVTNLLLDGIGVILQREPVGVIFLALSSAVYVGGVLWLNVLFAYKLVKVHQMNHAADDKLMYLAIKSSLLCFVSSCSSTAWVMGYVLLKAGIIQSPHLVFIISGVLLVCDVHTNFFSVLLTFNRFDAWYNKLCGRCCHQLCHRICQLCTGKKSVADAKVISTSRSVEVEPVSASGATEHVVSA